MKNRKFAPAAILSLMLLQLALPARGLAVKAATQGKADQTMTRNNTRQSPLACNATAQDAQQRQRIRVLLNQFHSDLSEARELSNGHSVRLSGNGSTIRDVAEFITLERLCCPFFDFTVQAQRENGPVWLTLTGRQGVKEFARLEFGLQEHTGPSTASTPVKESPLVCNDGALSPPQLERLVAAVKEIRTSKQETAELADGYAVRLPNSATMVQDIGEFMGILRLCSPYFETTLQVECEGGPVWLKITGREGVKALVKTELHI